MSESFFTHAVSIFYQWQAASVCTVSQIVTSAANQETFSRTDCGVSNLEMRPLWKPSTKLVVRAPQWWKWDQREGESHRWSMCYVITVPVTGLLCQSWSVLPQDCRLCLEAGDCQVHSSGSETRKKVKSHRWSMCCVITVTVTGDCTSDWAFESHLVSLIYLQCTQRSFTAVVDVGRSSVNFNGDADVTADVIWSGALQKMLWTICNNKKYFRLWPI